MAAQSTRIAAVAVIVEKDESREAVNRMIQEYADYVVGRLGIPYRKRGVSVIVLVVDASTDVVGALTGKLGRLDGVSAKTVFSKKEFLPEGDD
ncbi:MAG: iron-only hydrogenase system regulator [Thermoguttaceae bacterium]|nr:iron-only hydrogenase system regulator [Thermoguttaceae bacterium]